MRAAILISALIATPATAGTPATRPTTTPAYPIRLERPTPKGDRVAVEVVWAIVTSERTEWDHREDNVVESDDARGTRLVADVETVAVDPDGRPTHQRLTVRALTAVDDDGAESEVLPPGKVLVAKRAGNDTTFEVDDNPAPDKVKDAVRRIISLRPRKGGDDDTICGSTTPRRPGDEWPINPAGIVTAFKLHDTTVSPADVSGHTKLLAVEPVDAVPCLRLSADVDVKRFTEPWATTLPAGYKVHESSMTTHLEWAVPVDGAGMNLRETTTAVTRYVTEGRVDRRHYHSTRTHREEWHARKLPG